ncbi:MAG: DEAD/DEAH box helicase [Dehalococcoidia bacterium]|nr:MAG: DEAD/DEAH box helicase [Planctomycetaceae bacterium]RPJ56424.1 MAG: DEAD/DEAH box helicase [Dehalococcoidia bacterium]
MQFNSFNLDPRLRRNLQAIGFEQPTPIQSATIPPALEGHDILGSAETGTGKTAAFLLPLLQKLIALPRIREPRALILVPTRELALQVAEHAAQLNRSLPLRFVTIYGGVGLGSQEQALKRGVDVVIATPGRLLDHVTRRNIAFTSLQVLVLDEADRMLDIGFLPDIRRIVRLLPRERQTMLFSATLQTIVTLASEVTREPVRVEVEKTVTPDAITQVLYPVPEHLKFKLLQHLLEDESLDSVLIFARTKHRADRIVRDLQRAKISATVIHGNRSQSQRVAALEAFRRGRTRVLVATDIAARGIDVEGISHVVNYDVPTQPEDYVHRIGRTGRAQAIGQAYTLATPLDAPMIHRIEYVLKQKIDRRKVDGLDYSAPAARLPDAEAIRRYVEANRRKPQVASIR